MFRHRAGGHRGGREGVERDVAAATMIFGARFVDKEYEADAVVLLTA